VNGDTGLGQEKKIMVYTMQGLPKLINEKGYALSVDVIVLDEVHLYRTENYNSFVFPSDFRYAIGCSATPYTGMTHEEKN
jgi:superfamily II DNA or RNA helicase